jgi:polar amino acid transport system substrate-binding protein
MKPLAWLVIVGLVLPILALTSCSGPSTSTPVTKIRVATDASWPPFESINVWTDQIEGFDIDVMNAIAARENFTVEFVNIAFNPLLEEMARGTYDAAISFITITEDRQKTMLFSDPYFAAGQIVIVAKDNMTISGKDTLSGNVGVLEGSTGFKEVKKIKAATLVSYDKIGLAFEDLVKGQIDAVVCDNPVALMYVGKNPDKLKTAGKVFTDESYAIAVAKGKKELLAEINAGLKSIKSEGLIEQYSQKWFK